MKIDAGLLTLIDSGKQNPVGDLILATFASPTPISYLAKPILYYPYPNQTFNFNAEYDADTHKPTWENYPLTFRWKGITNASEYELIYGTDSEFRLTRDEGEQPIQTLKIVVPGGQVDSDGYIYQSVDFLQDFYDKLEEISPDAKYCRKSDFFWKVRGKEGSLVSEWTDAWKFHAHLTVYTTGFTSIGSPPGLLPLQRPYITSFIPSKSVVKKNEEIFLMVEAKDPSGEVPKLRWKGVGITNDPGEDYEETYYVSLVWSYGTDGTYLLQCQAVDSRGAASDWVGINVKVGVIRIWVSYSKDSVEWLAYSDDEGASFTHEQKP